MLSEIKVTSQLCVRPLGLSYRYSTITTHYQSVHLECHCFLLTIELVREEKNGKKYCASEAEPLVQCRNRYKKMSLLEEGTELVKIKKANDK